MGPQKLQICGLSVVQWCLVCAQSASIVSIVYRSKMANFQFFLDIVTIHNETSFVKHVLDPFYMVFTLFWCNWGGGGAAGKGAGPQPADIVFQPRQLKNGNLQNSFFFDISTIRNHQTSGVKHVLAPLCMFLTLFGLFFAAAGGVVPRGLGHNLLTQLSSFCSPKMENSETDFFLFFDHPQWSNILCKACF